MRGVVPLKWAAALRVSNVDKKTYEGDRPVRLCNYTDVYYNSHITNDLPFMEATASELEIASFGLQRGDVLFTKDSETAEDIAIPALVTSDLQQVVCGYHLAIARPIPGISEGRYLFWALSSKFMRDQFTVLATGVTRYGLRQNEMGHALLPLPDLHTQRVVADYLDSEIERINALVTKKQRLAEALASRRQAVINEAVESGSLFELISARDSSSDFSTPPGWLVTRLDYEASVHARIGWKNLTASEYVDEGYAFLSTSSLRGDYIDFEDANYITEFRFLESPELQLQEGDVLMTKDGAGIGWTAVVRSVPRPATVNGSIAVIRPRDSDGRFLYYALSSDAIQGLVGAFKSGMGVPHLFQADLKKFPLLKPSNEEQTEIADHLDEETARIDAVIKANDRSIALLAELRDSLIDACVTGKGELLGAKR